MVKKAGKIFTIDRFHSDPSLPREKSDQLYSEWVANSFRGLADIVIVARNGDEPVGFITCKVGRVASDFKYGVFDLVGVEPSEAGRGVGSALVHSALEWFATRVPSVYVGTQAANNRAVKLYERAGFRHVCSEASLHLWQDVQGTLGVMLRAKALGDLCGFGVRASHEADGSHAEHPSPHMGVTGGTVR